MNKDEKLYEILGELLYVVAKADGVIQPEEKEALKNIFQDHNHGKDILWHLSLKKNIIQTLKKFTTKY